MDNNLTLLTDLYQLTMMQGYYEKKLNQTAVFDLFFRENGIINYAVACGLEQAAEYIESIRFSDADINFLKLSGSFSPDFLKYLKDFRFSGNIDAVREGSIIFPGEPIITVKAPLIEAQFVETALLNIINHQTLIASKASRILEASGGAEIIEFGLRRAQAPDAGVYGARAAVIGGCSSTSNVLAAQKFGLKLKGTHAHSWVQSFDTELEAFRAYAETFPRACVLLVDTFNTLKSGIPNAIKVFDEMASRGIKLVKGIRLDSGDLAYLSKRARKMLDDAGHNDCIISASGDIDEHVILNLASQGAKIDVYGVGTRLITSSDMPSLGGVYKLSAILDQNGRSIPKMKLSENVAKMTLPGEKELYRIYTTDGKAVADLITLKGESISKPLKLTHPHERWKVMVLEDFTYKNLREPMFRNGKRVLEKRSVQNIADFKKSELNTFWEEYRRIIKPHLYKVDISDDLYELRQQLIAVFAYKNL